VLISTTITTSVLYKISKLLRHEISTPTYLGGSKFCDARDLGKI
jgi:hypothetical protein